ncbi:hypothetical protein M9Y10_013582 [Tritrichomonas musculus]|uniref:DUF3447 domain-containing protein n=1 Tax=Tritrichomonas musculus TaxID=1915356 RepID=A0ABR2KXW3_9EUKA
MYDHLIEYHNQTYGFIYDGTIEFQSLNFKFFLRFDHNESLYYAILSDDLDLLQKIVVLNEIDIQQLYKFPHFEIYFQFKSSTLLEYAAFFGSIQCFKYLLVNSNNIDFKILLECSIAGGNYDIIHIVENQSHDISITQNVNLLYLAILYMRNDLIEYLISTYDIKINAECYNKCIYSSNYDALAMLIDFDNAMSINDYGENRITPLCTASYEGYLDFFIYLLSFDETDLNKTGFYGKNILHYAVLGFKPEIIIYILSNRLIDPDDKDEFGETPEDIANYNVDIWGNIPYIFEYYSNIKRLELRKYNWIVDFNDFEDEKDFKQKKRYLDKKFKQKKMSHDFHMKRKVKNKKSKKKKFDLKFYNEDYRI